MIFYQLVARFKQHQQRPALLTQSPYNLRLVSTKTREPNTNQGKSLTTPDGGRALSNLPRIRGVPPFAMNLEANVALVDMLCCMTLADNCNAATPIYTVDSVRPLDFSWAENWMRAMAKNCKIVFPSRISVRLEGMETIVSQWVSFRLAVQTLFPAAALYHWTWCVSRCKQKQDISG